MSTLSVFHSPVALCDLSTLNMRPARASYLRNGLTSPLPPPPEIPSAIPASPSANMRRSKTAPPRRGISDRPDLPSRLAGGGLVPVEAGRVGDDQASQFVRIGRDR